MLGENGYIQGPGAPETPLPSDRPARTRPLSCRVGDSLFIAIGESVYRVSDKIEALQTRGERIYGLFRTPDDHLGLLTRRHLLSLDPVGEVEDFQTLYTGDSMRCAASGHGRIVIGTTDGRLIILSGEATREIEKGLPRQEIVSVFIDRENSIWAGLDSGGLIQLPRALFTSYTRADGVRTGDAFYIVADRLRGGVWVGTRNGGIAHITDEKVSSIDESDGLPSNRVRALDSDSEGRILIGTARGILSIEPSGQRHRLRTPDDSFFQFFFEDGKQRVFSGTRKGELEEIVAERSRSLAEANDALRKMAITDPLTGLFNRRFFEEEFPGELASTRRAFIDGAFDRINSSVALFMLDLDHFKRINDSWGHDAGDHVLREVARTIAEVIRGSDTLFRWGGEEFLLLARNANPESTPVLPEKIRKAVEDHVFVWEGEKIPITVSIGWVFYPFFSRQPGQYGWEELVHLADQALYLAKARGRNCSIGIVEGEKTADPRSSTVILEDIDRALELGFIRLTWNRNRGKGRNSGLFHPLRL